MNRYIRAMLEPAFPRITTAEIRRRIEELKRGRIMETRTAEIFTVPRGFAFECHDCRTVLKGDDGDKCAQLGDDSSTILCLSCLGKRQSHATQNHARVGPSEFKPKRAHRRKAPEWMEFD